MIKLKSLLTEMSQAQKELKKDYLFKQTHIPSSNQIPEWRVVWKAIKMSDGYKDYADFFKDREEEGYTEEYIEKMIEQEQYDRYLDAVYQYENSDGEDCWRAMTLKKEIDPTKIQQLGIYWSVDERKAEAHWGSGQDLKVKYRAKIDLKNVDWPGTIFARMDMSIGEEETEIRFLKYSKIFVYDVSIIDRATRHFTNYPIKDWRRA